MKYGVNGKILRVDLTARKHWVEAPNEVFYRTYFGGSALACHYLLKERGRIENPLGPENLLVFASSPLVGSGIPGANRYSVAAISPLTGIYGEGEAGGWWSPELKRAGFDAVLVEGRSERPVPNWARPRQPLRASTWPGPPRARKTFESRWRKPWPRQAKRARCFREA